jgi:hypothetical protein
MRLQVELLLVSLIRIASARGGSRGGSSSGGGGSSDRKTDCDLYAEFSSFVINGTGVVLLDLDDYYIRMAMNNSGVVDMPCESRTAPHG